MATALSASENRMMRDANHRHHHPWSTASSANAGAGAGHGHGQLRKRITTVAAEEFTSQTDWRTLPRRLERLVYILNNWVSPSFFWFLSILSIS